MSAEPTRQAVAKNATVWDRPPDGSPPDAAAAVPKGVPPPPEWTPPDVQLPAGWTSAKDPATGRVYFLDHKTKATHWELPGPPPTHSTLRAPATTAAAHAVPTPPGKKAPQPSASPEPTASGSASGGYWSRVSKTNILWYNIDVVADIWFIIAIFYAGGHFDFWRDENQFWNLDDCMGVCRPDDALYNYDLAECQKYLNRTGTVLMDQEAKDEDPRWFVTSMAWLFVVLGEVVSYGIVYRMHPGKIWPKLVFPIGWNPENQSHVGWIAYVKSRTTFMEDLWCGVWGFFFALSTMPYKTTEDTTPESPSCQIYSDGWSFFNGTLAIFGLVKFVMFGQQVFKRCGCCGMTPAKRPETATTPKVDNFGFNA